MVPVPRPEDYPASWPVEVAAASSVVLDAIDDNFDGPTRWTGDPVVQIERLRGRLDNLEAAVSRSRRMLRRIERQAVTAARRRGDDQ